jgi:hypothetical protein
MWLDGQGLGTAALAGFLRAGQKDEGDALVLDANRLEAPLPRPVGL